jgi:hypothetical protein
VVKAKVGEVLSDGRSDMLQPGDDQPVVAVLAPDEVQDRQQDSQAA